MPDDTLERALAGYLASPVDAERQPATWSVSPRLVALLERLAAERGLAVDALVEHLLFRQLRTVQARLLVGEPEEPVPASFVDGRVARAKAELAAEVAAVKARELPGDKAARIADEMQSRLDELSREHDSELEALRRRTAVDEAKVDLSLGKKRDS